jgi:hypothetical protein
MFAGTNELKLRQLGNRVDQLVYRKLAEHFFAQFDFFPSLFDICLHLYICFDIFSSLLDICLYINMF